MHATVVRVRSIVRAALVPVLSTLLLASGLGVVSLATASSASAALSSSAYEQRVQHWVNVQRSQHGKPSLRFARCPDGTAERWAGHLAESGGFYHQSMGRVLGKCDARYAGETLGKGAISPRTLVRMWMNSPGHRKVLLSRDSRVIGVGAKMTGSGQWVTAANFVRF